MHPAGPPPQRKCCVALLLACALVAVSSISRLSEMPTSSLIKVHCVVSGRHFLGLQCAGPSSPHIGTFSPLRRDPLPTVGGTKYCWCFGIFDTRLPGHPAIARCAIAGMAMHDLPWFPKLTSASRGVFLYRAGLLGSPPLQKLAATLCCLLP